MAKTSSLEKMFRAARRVSTPLICVRTPDPTATMALLSSAVGVDAPRIAWDCVRGAQPLNQPGDSKPSQWTQEAIQKLLNGAAAEDLCPPVECLTRAAKLPQGTVLFFLNAHRHLDNPQTIQAVWNLRDVFKSNRRTLVMLCPSIDLPPELAQDVVLLDEPLPTPAQLESIVKDQCSAIEFVPDETIITRAVDATSGLAAFSAEQVIAMSLTKEPLGIDLDGLWERKRQNIEQTPGLSVWRGTESFEDVRGCSNVLRFLYNLCAGSEPPRGIVFIDEIEKGTAGVHSDSSGVSQDQHQTFLTWMQDHNATGILAIGHPGTGKSLVAKAAGNSAGIPTIKMDLGGMKASHVGESEARVRHALKVVEAVTQGNALFIATCNKIADLPSELRRRFKFGTFFFDLPTIDERKDLWTMYLSKYKRKGKLPEDTGWTGAEINNCCDLSARLNCSLVEAASYIVPVAKSAHDQINNLRNQASGRFISASKPGLYTYAEETAAVSTRRAISEE